ncbi:hypothetical protein WBP07_31210 [Novosphingobium sp. BL-8A]|uniref:hypothetical protein n=1 Tax=Novosphingobium sp. BL-8A TaxID=3127639 RepID=UPI0037565EFC
MPFHLSKIAKAAAAPVALAVMVSSVPAMAAAPSAFERAMLAQLDAPTRAAVEKRAVGGNTVSGVIGTTLLNNYYAAGARKPGEALNVVAVDFARGTVVFRRSANVFEVQRFDPRTLHMQR